ncbi:hypothetical protein DPMN_114212 [Dreissena polymorpha]|uniref:Uncharacterized protein n=1 Tax=Dreissena polymorpha TaxID=45954 RepID=A0A9D4KJG4_DREPO|nr:hypothetical protein DPMN_114212 [Dreissena polymorpha]
MTVAVKHGHIKIQKTCKYCLKEQFREIPLPATNSMECDSGRPTMSHPTIRETRLHGK